MVARAPRRRIRIRQGVTVAIAYYEADGYTRRVETYHHPVAGRVYYRQEGGRKQCVKHFRSAARRTASTSAKRPAQRSRSSAGSQRGARSSG